MKFIRKVWIKYLLFVIIIGFIILSSNIFYSKYQIYKKDLQDTLYFREFAQKNKIWKDSLKRVLGDTISSGNPTIGSFYKTHINAIDSSVTNIWYVSGVIMAWKKENSKGVKIEERIYSKGVLIVKTKFDSLGKVIVREKY